MPRRSSGPPRRARRHRARARKRSSLAFVVRLGSRRETRRGRARRFVSPRVPARAATGATSASAAIARATRAGVCVPAPKGTTRTVSNETAAGDWSARSSKIPDYFRVDRKGLDEAFRPFFDADEATGSIDRFLDERFAPNGIVASPEKGARVVRPRGALYRGDGRDEVLDRRHSMADADARVLGDAEGPHRGRDDGTLPQAWTLPFPPALCRNHDCCGTDRHLRAREGSRARASPLPSASAEIGA